MDNKECCIPGHEGQTTLIFTHRHWASFLKTIVITCFFLLLPIIILTMIYFLKSSFFHGVVLNFIVIAISLYYMVMTTFAFTEWISFYYNILAVTETEVIEIVQNGIFDRKISEISILRIQDVSAEVNGFWPTLFGYGDVVVESAGDNTQKYIIKDIPRPNEVASEILKFHNDQIAREDRGNEMAVGEGDLRKNGISSFNQNHNEIPPESEKVEYPPLEQSLSEPTPPEPTPSSEPMPTEPTASEENPNPNQDQDNSNDSAGDISKDDLDKGGEVKF